MTQDNISILTDTEFEEFQLLIGDALTYYYGNEELRNDHSVKQWQNLHLFKKVVDSEHKMIKELRELVLEKQYLHTTDLRIKLERILGKQDGDSV